MFRKKLELRKTAWSKRLTDTNPDSSNHLCNIVINDLGTTVIFAFHPRVSCSRSSHDPSPRPDFRVVNCGKRASKCDFLYLGLEIICLLQSRAVCVCVFSEVVWRIGLPHKYNKLNIAWLMCGAWWWYQFTLYRWRVVENSEIDEVRVIWFWNVLLLSVYIVAQQHVWLDIISVLCKTSGGPLMKYYTRNLSIPKVQLETLFKR